MVGEDFAEPPIDEGRFIDITADDLHALFLQPGIHLPARDTRRSFPLAGGLVLFALGLDATHDPAGAVDGRVEVLPGFPGLDPFQDDGIVTHGTADESLLSRERRRSTFADDPQGLPFMNLSPSKVV